MGASRSLGSFPAHSAQWCHCIVRGRWWLVVNFSDTQSSKLGRPSRVPAKLDRLDQKPIWKTRDRLFPLVVCSLPLVVFFVTRSARVSSSVYFNSLATARGGQQGVYLLLTPTRPGARTSLQFSHPKLLKQGAVGVEAARVLQDLYKFWRLCTCRASGWMVDWFRRGASYLGVRIRGLSTRLFQQTTLEEWFMWQCVCVSARFVSAAVLVLFHKFSASRVLAYSTVWLVLCLRFGISLLLVVTLLVSSRRFRFLWE